MTEVVPLKTITTPTAPVDQDLIEGLKALLEMAKKGEVQGIMYCMIKTRGLGQYEGVLTGWRGKLGGQHIALGALETLRHRFMIDSYEY